MLLSRRTRLNRLHHLWVVLLMLCTWLQPGLVLACEAHESGHLIQTGHSHDADDHSDVVPADERVSGHGASLLDALLHQGHCCVHGAAIVGHSELRAGALAQVTPEVAVVAPLRCIGRVPMLRPPIRIG